MHPGKQDVGCNPNALEVSLNDLVYPAADMDEDNQGEASYSLQFFTTEFFIILTIITVLFKALLLYLILNIAYITTQIVCFSKMSS